MKGFAGLLITMAIFIAAILLIGINNQTTEENSLKETITETKLILANYEFVLTQMAQDCDTTTVRLDYCVDANAQTLLSEMPITFLECRKTSTATNITADSAKFELQCTAEIKKQNDPLLNITLKKDIIIKKN